jgi:hypothetical protein
MEMYYFIKKLQYKHLQFSSDYLKKYFTPGEKILHKNKDKLFIAGSAAFSVKTLAAVLPQDGLIMFIHSLILIVFSCWVIRTLILTKENIFSYYK